MTTSPLDRQIRQVKRETTRLLKRISKELDMKFGQKKPTDYTVIKSHHRENSHKSRRPYDEARVARTGNLSRFDLAAAPVKVVVQADIPEPKVHAQCRCTHRTIDGKQWSVMSPDCPDHGTFRENLRFVQGEEKAPLMRRKGVTSY